MAQVITHDNGLYVVAGRRGSGKTSWALTQIVRLRQQYARDGREFPRVLTNVGLSRRALQARYDLDVELFTLPWPCPSLHPSPRDGEQEDVLYPCVHDRSAPLPHWSNGRAAALSPVEDCIIILDEVHKFFEGKRTLPPDLTNLIAELRKRRITLIMMTPPLSNVPAAIRRTMDRYIQCIDTTQTPLRPVWFLKEPPARKYLVRYTEKGPWDQEGNQERDPMILSCFDTQASTFGFLAEEVLDDDVKNSHQRWTLAYRRSAASLLAACLVIGLCFRGVYNYIFIHRPRELAERAAYVERLKSDAEEQRARRKGLAIRDQLKRPSDVQVVEALPQTPEVSLLSMAPVDPPGSIRINPAHVRAVGEDRDGRRIVRHAATPGRWFLELQPGLFTEYTP